MDDLNLYAKNEKDLESFVQIVQIFEDDTGMDFGIDKNHYIDYKEWEHYKVDVI